MLALEQRSEESVAVTGVTRRIKAAMRLNGDACDEYEELPPPPLWLDLAAEVLALDLRCSSSASSTSPCPLSPMKTKAASRWSAAYFSNCSSLRRKMEK